MYRTRQKRREYADIPEALNEVKSKISNSKTYLGCFVSATYFGQTYDEETGLYYLRARYYDSTTGRFTQQDSAEDGYNWYIYGNQNPVMFVDYTGGSTVIISAALYLLGMAITFVAGIYALKPLVALTYQQFSVLNQSLSFYNSKSASSYINWDKDTNGKSHVLKGSKNSKDAHGPIWKKFNIDPNNNDWWKLLPILQEVVNKGQKTNEALTKSAGKVTGHLVYYTKQFIDKGVEIIVKLNVDNDGNVWFSDAWGNLLN